MKGMHLVVAISACVLSVTGCTTSGRFSVPADTQLYLFRRPQPVVIAADGTASTRPFSWSAAGGVPYKLKKNGAVVKEGKLRVKFRVVSIFWPPFAALYWPMGLNPSLTYDLVNGTQGVK